MSDPDISGEDTPSPTVNRVQTNLGGPRGGPIAARRRMYEVAKSVTTSVASRNTYAYKNIDYDNEIRVLKVYPGTPGSDIACRLLRCPLVDSAHQTNSLIAIPYAAISYYWGDDEPKKKIYIFDTDEGHEDWLKMNIALRVFAGYMRVRENLHSLLEQLRLRDQPVYLWADALCINQSNTKERTAQVARMHDVYSQAERVYVWLGQRRETENERAFAFLRRILDLQELERVVTSLEQRDNGNTWENDREDCKRVIDLMKAKWFGRRWIIQELALAANAHVRCGGCQMPWTEFADAIALFMTKYDHIRRAFGGPRDYSASRSSDDYNISSLDAKALGANTLVTMTSNLFRKSSEGRIIQRLLSLELLVSSMLLTFEASDPKDTVFAVLQIAKDTQTSRRPQQSPSTKRTLTRVLIPLLGIITLWRLNFFALMPFDFNVEPGTEILLMNMDLSARQNMFLVTTYCIVGLGALLCWLIFRMMFDALVEVFVHIRTHADEAPKPLDTRLEANYQKCLRDVCADFIEYSIESSKSLDILCRHWAPQPKPSSNSQIITMPSWILPVSGHAFGGPQQSLNGRANGDSFVGGSERRSHYMASGTLYPSVKFGKTKLIQEPAAEVRQELDEYTKKPTLEEKKEFPPRFDGTLSVKGFELDVIEETAAVVGPVISRMALELCGWSEDTEAMDIDQVWRVLVANRGPDGTNAPSWYRRACEACLEWYGTQAESHFNTNNLKDMPGTPSAKVEFLERVQQVVWNRTIIRTRGKTGREYIAIAPQKAQLHDIICVLFGCSVPVVLRQIKDSREYKFIGECYVHGIMDGEAVDPVPSMAREQWFKLR